MGTEEVSPPFFPWEKAEGGAEKLRTATAELERLGWTPADGGEWFAHTASGWLCNPSEKVYFHSERNILLPAQPQAAATEVAAASEALTVDAHQERAECSQGNNSTGEIEEEEEEEEEGEEGDLQSDDDSDFMLDLEDDLDAATAQKKGSAEGKDTCEDRFITRAGLPLGFFAGSTEGLCYFSAIYDGHAGTEDGAALRLTEDHKPNTPSEKKRIEAAGGQVASIQGIWRVLSSDSRRNRTFGLSTARALGDSALKKPKPLVISHPTVHVYTLHFDRDAFLVSRCLLLMGWSSLPQLLLSLLFFFMLVALLCCLLDEEKIRRGKKSTG
ncbi:protein phosphatase 2C, putative [Eimeria mitis]|uniref:protein-serine/threonine phosphatase n=1 Tax=Eimeria mitis TaxID=44415 RepID=U6KL94_9EIME|nr:protein phosphatase 2C, putative [Eimeria mitis]CDJ36228.1 protein phosphatase 2C, putative [Eimeria mitis]